MWLRILAFIIVLSPFAAVGAPLSTPDGFSIYPPPGWVQIPYETIVAAEKEARRQAPNAPQTHSDYAFQFGHRDTWFEYPYLLVNVDRQGRIPESQLTAASNVDLNSTTKKTQEALQNVASDLQIGQPRYDPVTHIVWIKVALNTEASGRVLGVTAVIPTQSGHIDVRGYSHEEDYLSFAGVFQEFVSALVLDPKEKYRPIPTSNFPFLRGFSWESLLTTALGGAILAALAGLRKKK